MNLKNMKSCYLFHRFLLNWLAMTISLRRESTTGQERMSARENNTRVDGGLSTFSPLALSIRTLLGPNERLCHLSTRTPRSCLLLHLSLLSLLSNNSISLLMMVPRQHRGDQVNRSKPSTCALTRHCFVSYTNCTYISFKMHWLTHT